MFQTTDSYSWIRLWVSCKVEFITPKNEWKSVRKHVALMTLNWSNIPVLTGHSDSNGQWSFISSCTVPCFIYLCFVRYFPALLGVWKTPWSSSNVCHYMYCNPKYTLRNSNTWNSAQFHWHAFHFSSGYRQVSQYFSPHTAALMCAFMCSVSFQRNAPK